VNWPVIATDRFRWLGWLVFGLTRVSKGAPLTVNPLVSVTISAFVVSVTQEQTGSVSSNTQSLFEAVRRGEGSRIRTAIEAGVDVNSRDADGNTLLMQSAVYATAANLEFLLAHSSNVNAANKAGHTALMRAMPRTVVTRAPSIRRTSRSARSAKGCRSTSGFRFEMI